MSASPLVSKTKQEDLNLMLQPLRREAEACVGDLNHE